MSTPEWNDNVLLHSRIFKIKYYYVTKKITPCNQSFLREYRRSNVATSQNEIYRFSRYKVPLNLGDRKSRTFIRNSVLGSVRRSMSFKSLPIEITLVVAINVELSGNKRWIQWPSSIRRFRPISRVIIQFLSAQWSPIGIFIGKLGKVKMAHFRDGPQVFRVKKAIFDGDELN